MCYESKTKYLLFFINYLNNANTLPKILENDIYGEEAAKYRINFKSKTKEKLNGTEEIF